MKTIFTLLISLILCNELIAQTNVCDTITLKTYKILKDDLNDPKNGSMLVTWRTFNSFMNQKINYFLTGIDGFTLYKTSTSLDAKEGKLTILGHSIGNKKPFDDIRHITSYGLNANIYNGYSNIVNNDKLNNNVSFNLKHNWIFWKSISFSPQEKLPFDSVRILSVYEIECYLEKWCIDNNCMVNITMRDSTIKKLYQQSKTKKDLTKNLNDIFYGNELSHLEKDYHSLRMAWFSFYVEPKLGQSDFFYVLNRSDTIVNTHSQSLVKGGVIFNFLHERPLLFPKLSYYLGLGLSYYLTNEAEIGNLKKDSYQAINVLNNNNKNYILRNSSQDVFIGQMNTINAISIRPQILIYPFSKIWGIDIINEFIIYNGSNSFNTFTFGIPLNLINSDNKPINFEIQFKHSNVNYFGLKVGFPFGSKIY